VDCRAQTVRELTKPKPKPARSRFNPSPGKRFGGRRMRLRLDGSWILEPSATYQALVRHAERFGVESVYETAEESGLSAADLARLKVELASVADGRRSRFGTKAKTAALNGGDVQALYESGLTPEEIASELRWSLGRVRKVLREGVAHVESGS
jgi:hypothetical protein